MGLNAGSITFNTGGNKTFRFSVVDRNVNSTGYTLAFDYIELVPTPRYEAEKLTVQAKSPPSHKIFSATKLSGGAATIFSATAVGHYVAYNIPVAKPGTYRVKVGAQSKYNKGIFQLSIFGENQGFPQDEYSAAIAAVTYDLGSVTFTSGGDKTFKFTVTGKNGSSTGYTLAFDYVELVPQ